jgi:hypothetical protein
VWIGSLLFQNSSPHLLFKVILPLIRLHGSGDIFEIVALLLI